MLGPWAQQHLLFCPLLSQHLAACDTWRRASGWEKQRHQASPPWKHCDFSAASTMPARAPPPALLSFLPPLPGSQEMLQSVLLIFRAALVGGKSRIHCSILLVAGWNPPETLQPHMAGQRRTGNGGQAPTLPPDCGGCFRGRLDEHSLEHGEERHYILTWMCGRAC